MPKLPKASAGSSELARCFSFCFASHLSLAEMKYQRGGNGTMMLTLIIRENVFTVLAPTDDALAGFYALINMK